MEENKVPEEKIIAVIADYLKRLLAGAPKADDSRIDYPQCDAPRRVEYQDTFGYSNGHWECLNNCGFRFPQGLVPPSPKELQAYLRDQEIANLVEQVKLRWALKKHKKD